MYASLSLSRLYHKASKIAEILSDSVGEGGVLADEADAAESDESDGEGARLPDGPGFGLDNHHHDKGKAARDVEEAEEGGDQVPPGQAAAAGRRSVGYQAFGAFSQNRLGPLDWSLVSRLTRAKWEKSMASCCLGMVLQHRCGRRFLLVFFLHGLENSR